MHSQLLAVNRVICFPTYGAYTWGACYLLPAHPLFVSALQYCERKSLTSSRTPGTRRWKFAERVGHSICQQDAQKVWIPRGLLTVQLGVTRVGGRGAVASIVRQIKIAPAAVLVLGLQQWCGLATYRISGLMAYGTQVLLRMGTSFISFTHSIYTHHNFHTYQKLKI